MPDDIAMRNIGHDWETRENRHPLGTVSSNHGPGQVNNDTEQRRRAAGPFIESRVGTETCYSEERGTGPLGVFDVFSLIANKMIGTGIYTAPASVFLLTGSKQLTLGLFGVGFFHSLISTFLYLDFAAAFPYTGGELVYISEMTACSGKRESPARQRASSNGLGHNLDGGSAPATNPAEVHRWRKTKRIFGDGLLAYVAYSILFIIFFNSGTNSMQTGRLILLCVNAGDVDANGMTPDVNRDLVRFIGIVVLSIICLLQYFSPSVGRKLNRAFAIIKILTLLALIGVAGNAARTRTKNRDKAGEWIDKVERHPLSFAKAILAVLFSFEGWENATFVRAILSRSTSRPPGLTDHRRFLLTGNGTAARRGWANMSAISSLGSLNSIIYTFSRVKQAICQADILPWSKIWKKDDTMDRGRNVSEQETRNPTNPQHYIHKAPQGGLLIHWTMSVVVIAGSSATQNTIESIGIPGYIQTYVHVFILCKWPLTLLSNVRAEQNTDDVLPSMVRPSKLTGFFSKSIWYLLWFVYMGMNVTIIAVDPVPPYSGSDGSDVSFPGWGFPAILFSVLLFAVLYYFAFFCSLPRDYRSRQAPGNAPGEVKDEVPQWWTWHPFQAAGVKAKFEFDEDYNEGLPRVFRFGRRWKVIYSIEGDRDGEEYGSSNTKQFLYWVFGGDRLKETPPERLWECLKEQVHAI
ncbi:amino acid permease-domain-containing protein [Apiosordaria backusii]|uniref:Amino acid permease-domain-containing protein n=1 Tax=Apiosordaria backusii TaxID=314023 RepID=A0AA40EMC7_9PEZI|nr:amino acid permease-domain-containing protein [Apiosordaria backusii]